MIHSNKALAQQKWASCRIGLTTGWRRLLGWVAVPLSLALGAGVARAKPKVRIGRIRLWVTGLSAPIGAMACPAPALP